MTLLLCISVTVLEQVSRWNKLYIIDLNFSPLFLQQQLSVFDNIVLELELVSTIEFTDTANIYSP